MDAEDSRNLLKLTNSSGFIFQVGVRHEIERTFNEHGWKILTEEHHWRHPDTGESRYADLLLAHSELTLKLVIECKRATDIPWVFLVPEGVSNHTKPHPLSIFLVALPQDGRKVARWEDFRVRSPDPESSYCVVDSQGDKQTPMIERITDGLLPAVEAIGLQDLALFRPRPMPDFCLFLPILITNAHLCTCEFDPGKVNMDTGKLAEGAFEDVQFLRFRKALASTLDLPLEPSDLSDANHLRERSILVVRSTAIAVVLKSLATALNEDRRLGTMLAHLDQGASNLKPEINSNESPS